MYPQAGQQNYTGLPVAIYDVTNKGHLWDLKLNYQSYFFSNENGFSYTADTPIQQQDPQKLGWLKFLGYWGDQKLEPSNPVSRVASIFFLDFQYTHFLVFVHANSIKLASDLCAFTKVVHWDPNRNHYPGVGYVVVPTASLNQPCRSESDSLFVS